VTGPLKSTARRARLAVQLAPAAPMARAGVRCHRGSPCLVVAGGGWAGAGTMEASGSMGVCSPPPPVHAANNSPRNGRAPARSPCHTRCDPAMAVRHTRVVLCQPLQASWMDHRQTSAMQWHARGRWPLHPTGCQRPPPPTTTTGGLSSLKPRACSLGSSLFFLFFVWDAVWGPLWHAGQDAAVLVWEPRTGSSPQWRGR
jgi:hypothetical protein